MMGLLFTYMLTYGGSVTALFKPYAGVLIYVCFAILRPEALWHWSVPAGNYSRIVAISLLVGWAFAGFGTWRFGRAGVLVTCLLLFWALTVTSAVMAPDQTVAWGFIEAFSKIALPFLVAATLIDSVEKLKQLVWVIVMSQGYVAWELNLAYYSGFNKVVVMGFGGMDNNCVAISMVAGIGLALFLGLTAAAIWQKLLALAAAALMAHVVLFSFSRGGMLALIAVVGTSFFLAPKQPRHYVALALAAALGLRLAGTEVQARFLTIFASSERRDESAGGRLQLWADCLDSMTKHPLFGVGPDHWPLIVEQYGWPAGKHAHTLWLQVGAELGVPALAFLLLFYLGTIARLWPLMRDSTEVSDPWLRDAARMVVASLLGFILSAQFVSLPGLEVPYYVALVGVGALKVASLAPTVEEPLPEVAADLNSLPEDQSVGAVS